MPKPVEPEALREALKTLEALGPRPMRRRPAYAWDQIRGEMRTIIQQEWPGYAPKLREAGYCGKCQRYIGRGRNMHEDHCKSDPVGAIMNLGAKEVR